MKRFLAIFLIILLMAPAAIADFEENPYKVYNYIHGTTPQTNPKVYEDAQGLTIYFVEAVEEQKTVDYTDEGEGVVNLGQCIGFRFKVKNLSGYIKDVRIEPDSINGVPINIDYSSPYNCVEVWEREYNKTDYTFNLYIKKSYLDSLNVKKPYNLTMGFFIQTYTDSWSNFYTSKIQINNISATTKSNLTGEAYVTSQVKATKIKLNKSSAKLNCGDSIKLKATLTPKNASKDVAIISSNPSVALVNSDGSITGVKPGKATITFKAVGGKTAKCKITVNPITIKLNKKSGKLDTGKSYQLTAKVSAKGEEYSKVTWTSSNTSVATVDANGLITAVKPGKATITATAYGGKTAKYKLTVNPITVKLSKKSAKLTVGESGQLTAKVNTTDPAYSAVTYKSSRNDIATVDATGKVTALKPGKATITATAYGGKTAKCVITVTPLKVNYISVDCPTEMHVGEKHKISVCFYPENASVKTLTFKTSNKGVLTVDKAGNLVAKKAGTAKITITPKSNTKAKLTVSVTVK